MLQITFFAKPISAGVILSVVCYILLHGNLQWISSLGTNLKGNKLLIIGVLSARDNFEHRQAVRTTWGKLLDGEVDLKFIIGSRFCPVPIEDRATQFKCDEWIPQLSEGGSTITKTIDTESLDNDFLKFVGYTFIVKQNLTIVDLSLCADLLTPENRIARVIIYNSLTGEVAASATFGYDPSNQPGSLIKKGIRHVHLDTSFEGEVKIVSQRYNYCSCRFVLNFPCAVHVFEGVDQEGNYIDFPYARSQHSALGGFHFYIQGVANWRHHHNERPSRNVRWKSYNSILQDKLDAECNEHKDVLLVDLEDVYASLSFKVLKFLTWVSTQNYDFVLKTDDDVFLDTKEIVGVLQEGGNWDWWTCLKVGWPAPNSGKWRDRISKPRIYSSFPSGSGYVIKMTSLKKLLSSSSKLEPTTGEDVFIGVLASGLNFKHLVKSSCYWSCNEMCPEHPCNVPELSPERMKTMWLSYLNCSKICDCLDQSRREDQSRKHVT